MVAFTGVAMDMFGIRLRQERKRLGLSQKMLAYIGGIQKNAQSVYERGLRVPDSLYLSKVSAVGVDVTYLLTDKRTGVDLAGPNDPDELSPEAIAEQMRESIRAMAEAVSTMTKLMDSAAVRAAGEKVADRLDDLRAASEECISRAIPARSIMTVQKHITSK